MGNSIELVLLALFAVFIYLAFFGGCKMACEKADKLSSHTAKKWIYKVCEYIQKAKKLLLNLLGKLALLFGAKKLAQKLLAAETAAEDASEEAAEEASGEAVEEAAEEAEEEALEEAEEEAAEQAAEQAEEEALEEIGI